MYLETMKKRFTEGELNNCEVMIRDIRDSASLAKEAAMKMVRENLLKLSFFMIQ